MSFIQNLLMPLFATSLYLSKRYTSFSVRIKIGLLLGASFGAIPATLGTIIENIQFYFLGGETAAFAARNQTIPPLSPGTLWAGISSQFYIWLLLILISAFSGLLAALIPTKEGPKL